MKEILRDLRSWHQRYYPEWYKPITTKPVFDSRGKHVGNRLIENPLLTGRDGEFEQLMKRLEASDE